MKNYFGLKMFSGVAVLCASLGFGQTPQTQPGPNVQVSPQVRAKAQSPAPPATAQPKPASSTIGTGKAALSGTGHSASDYVDWAEDIDVLGDGQVQSTDVAYDNKYKVIYFSRSATFNCKGGGTGDGGILMAVYGKGNTLGRPAGSGWFVVDLDKGECSAPAAGLYGCKFDPNGNPTACGSAVIDEATSDVRITTVSMRQ